MDIDPKLGLSISRIDISSSLKTVGQPRLVSEDIPDSHGSLARARDVVWVDTLFIDSEVSELREVAMNRVAEGEARFFVQHHQGN